MVVEPIDDLNSIESEWAGFWEQTPEASPFQHPAWVLPWWGTFGSGRLFSFAARDQGKLAGLALLFLHEWRGRRQVTFLGNGVSDRLDVLGDATVASSFLDVLAEQRRLWDLADLQDLAECSSLLRSQRPTSVRSEVQPQYVCSYIPLPDSTEEFHRNLPSGLRRNLRRYRKQLDEQGEVSFETSTVRTFPQLLESFFDLHRARWAMKEEPCMIDGSPMEDFHRTAAIRLSEAGLASLHAMRLNGAVVAITYVLNRGERTYSYLGGFDPQFVKFSPGALILEYTVNQAIERGASTFDFLRGDEDYKLQWGAQRTSSKRLLLWPEP